MVAETPSWDCESALRRVRMVMLEADASSICSWIVSTSSFLT